MANGIFDTRPGTAYDDEITSRYHFPNRYLQAALACTGDWIIYREPQRSGGRAGYVAVARVASVGPDSGRPGFSYARMDGFLPFDATVPLDGPSGAYEALVRQAGPGRRGVTLQGRSVRPVGAADFAAIVRAGLRETPSPSNATRLGLDAAHVDTGTLALVGATAAEQERRIGQVLANRPIRDASFRRQVIDAYDGRCAVTGLRLVNGGGRAEAQAAHIRPVAEGGPDTVQNGIALSATVHWLFDRNLIALTDGFGLLVAHNRVPVELRVLFDRQVERVHLPNDPALWPHLRYVGWHRERFAGY